MASQASQIAKQITALKRDLQTGKQDAQSLSAQWRSLETLISQAGKPRELWKDALTREVLDDLVSAILSTFQKDKSGEASVPVGGVLEGIWAALQSAASQFGPTDVARVTALVDGTILAAEEWWAAYEKSITNWKKQGAQAYDAKAKAISSALCTMQLQLETGPSANRGGLKTIATSSLTTLQNLVLTEMALSNDDKSFYRLAKLSVAMLDQSKIEEFPAVVENPSLLAQRFNRNANPDRTDAEDLTAAYDSLYCLLKIPKIAIILRTDDNLCITVASGMWKWYEDCGIKPIPMRNKGFAWIASVVAQLFPGKPEQMATRFTAVMREHDFISVIIKILYAFGQLQGPLDVAPTSETKVIWKHWEDLKKYIISKPALFKAPLQSILKGKLLGALDIIRCNKGPNYSDAATKYMEELGSFADLKEADLRKAAIEERQRAQGGIVGCSWYRCVLYRQATDQVMHWCAGCKKVVYCGVLCQTRDWEEGHKDACQPSS